MERTDSSFFCPQTSHHDGKGRFLPPIDLVKAATTLPTTSMQQESCDDDSNDNGVELIVKLCLRTLLRENDVLLGKFGMAG